MIPGQILPADKDIQCNAGCAPISLVVTNTSESPILVGSHYPFFDANPALDFPRNKAKGYRLGIPAGTTVRFEPGQCRTVELVPFGGNKVLYGRNAAKSTF